MEMLQKGNLLQQKHSSAKENTASPHIKTNRNLTEINHAN